MQFGTSFPHVKIALKRRAETHQSVARITPEVPNTIIGDRERDMTGISASFKLLLYYSISTYSLFG